MWEYRPWDYGYTMDNLRQSLYLMSEYIDKRGLEVDESRRKKVYYMKRCIHLIDLLAQDDFDKQAEINLGKKLVIRPFRLEPIEGSTSKMLEFDDRWNIVWGNPKPTSIKHKNEEQASRENFNNLRKGVLLAPPGLKHPDETQYCNKIIGYNLNLLIMFQVIMLIRDKI